MIYNVVHVSCEVFEAVKELLGSVFSLKTPDFSRTFYLNPSVGPNAIGAILLQQGNNSSYMRLVYYVSRLKNDAERRYTNAQIVLASLVYACRRLRSYLLPHPFVVMTSYTLLLEFVNNSNLSKGMIK